MKCPICGKTIRKDSKYCSFCGSNLSLEEGKESGFKTRVMICEKCGGNMDITGKGDVLCCPFCGSKKIYIESDQLKIEKYKVDTYKEIQKSKDQASLKMAKKKLETLETLAIITIPMVILLIMIILAMILL